MQKGTDAWFMQTQCLLHGTAAAAVDVRVRFLQAVSRKMGKPAARVTAETPEPEVEIVETLEIGNKTFQSWQEAIERDIVLPRARLADLLAGALSLVFAFPGAREMEPVRDESGAIVAFIVRTREGIRGSVKLSAEKCRRRPVQADGGDFESDASRRSFLSASRGSAFEGASFCPHDPWRCGRRIRLAHRSTFGPSGNRFGMQELGDLACAGRRGRL